MPSTKNRLRFWTVAYSSEDKSSGCVWYPRSAKSPKTTSTLDSISFTSASFTSRESLMASVFSKSTTCGWNSSRYRIPAAYVVALPCWGPAAGVAAFFDVASSDFRSPCLLLLCILEKYLHEDPILKKVASPLTLHVPGSARFA